MTFLIDGYNLMHAVGLASRTMPARGLHRARGRFLDWLADAAESRASQLCVVFDAQAVPNSSAESHHRGIRVRFSSGQSADELIEDMVRSERSPAGITVVSNDGQVQESGRVRGCPVFRCEEFVDWLIAKPSPVDGDPAVPAGKVEPEATPEEMARWLDAFTTPKKKRR